MKVGIMQPYFMPYFNYFKLIKLVDKFIILDDVNFIKKGWINRNQIIVNNKPYLFTFPIISSSQNKKINELWFSGDPSWRVDFLKTVKHSYIKSPQFKKFYPLLENIVEFDDLNVSSYIGNSLELVCKYLRIETEILRTTSNFHNQALVGQDRIIDICNKNNCTEYFNLPGGKDLYSETIFKDNGIVLKFIENNDVEYKQFIGEPIKNLSMIDYLMFNDPVEFNTHCCIN